MGKVFQKALKKQRCVGLFPRKVRSLGDFSGPGGEKKEQKNSKKKRKSPLLFIICFLSAHVFRREGERKEDEKTRPDDDVDDDDDEDDVCRRFGLSSLAGESFYFFVFGDQTIREKRRDGRIGEE